ncbi:LacI family transcriptional regulator [Termitidicoccus mucosus]|uniref:HTH lacI-type domain-containing protein n=1 Tax=Termitidicoccus mucosus TaxID=1184151 RepID=A0A178IPA8_9BACT|nr:hypothetical protein AW736_05415 [Opitutaceae bacterium TSB47]
MTSAPTIRDIAKVAGVHFTTVGLALRNDPRITGTTAARVRAAAEKLGYRPNPMVSALMKDVRGGRLTHSHVTIGFCSHWEWEGREGWKHLRTHRLFFEGASQRAESLGYHIDHFNLAQAGYTPARWSQIFKARNITGLILASFEKLTHDLPLDWDAFSTVRIDPNPQNPHLDTVCTNHSQTVRVAFRQARARGYKRIALVSHQLWDERLGDALLSGFLVEQSTVPVRQRVPAFRTYDWTKEAFAAWHAKTRPDAIIAMNDEKVLGWLDALNIKVPRDLGFISLDQKPETAGIAGMRKNHELLGASATDMVIGKMQHNERGIPEFPRLTLIAGKWIDGKSIRPLPKGIGDPSAYIG